MSKWERFRLEAIVADLSGSVSLQGHPYVPIELRQLGSTTCESIL